MFTWAVRDSTASPLHGMPITGGTGERDRVLADAELAEVWAAANKIIYPWGPVLRLAIRWR